VGAALAVRLGMGFLDDDPGLDGPDYLALVIEWDQIADAIDDEISRASPPQLVDHPFRMVVAAAGALAALGFAVWGIRRIHAA